jgi:hypothetical protein
LARRIEVDIIGDASSLQRSFKAADASAKEFNGVIGSVRVGLGALVKSFVVIEVLDKAFEGLTETFRAGIDEFKETTQIQAQTAAAIKSTGDISGVTAKQIHGLSLELSNLSGQSDESVQAAENVLLSFTNIRNSLGKNNDVFTQATKAVVDFSARTGRDAPAAAVLLGKALQDPAKRVGILARAGVVLSQSQTAVLKSVEKNQGILAAQKILLADLATRFQGAAAAAGKTLPGALNILKERFRDLAGEGIAKVQGPLTSAANALAGFVVKLTDAKGAAAKFKIAVDGLKSLGKSLTKAIGDAVAQINWDQIWARAKDIGKGLQQRLAQIDFKGIGQKIGDGIAQAIKVAVPAVAELANKITSVISSIDWEKVGQTVGPGLATAIVTAFATLTDVTFWARHWDLALSVAAVAFSGPLGKLGSKLLEPFARVGVRLAESFALAIASTVEKIAPEIADPVLNVLLRLPAQVARIVSGLAAPFVSLFNRLGRIATFSIKVLGIKFALDQIADFFRKAKQVLAKPIAVVLDVTGVSQALSQLKLAFHVIIQTITGDFSGLWKTLEKQAINAALAIVEPFTHLPKILGGGPFQEIKAELQKQLDGMKTSAATSGNQIGQALGDGISQGFASKAGVLAQQEKSLIPTTAIVQAKTAAKQTRQPAAASPLKPVASDLLGAPTQPKGITADQRNTFFDSSIGRLLDQAQDGKIQQQIAKLKAIGGLITKRIAATKDVTRRLTLEQQLLDNVTRPIQALEATEKSDALQASDDAFQKLVDSLQLNVDRASVTKGTADDIAAVKALMDGIKTRIKAVGATSDLEQQLLAAEQNLKDVNSQRAQNVLDSLQLNVDRAAVTKSTSDDISTLTALKNGIKARIKAVGETSDLEQQLLAVTQQMATVRSQVAQGILDALNLKLTRAQATPSQQDDLSVLDALQKTLKKQIKAVGATNDLEQQLLAATQQIKGVRDQVRQGILDTLNFAVTKASATKSQQDDLAALNNLQATLKKQIRAEGATLDLQQQLFDVEQKRKDALAQVRANAVTARNAAQFKTLGLTATGDDRIAGVKALKAELGNVGKALEGSFLDTSKTKSLIQHIRGVLSGGLGAISVDVRSKVKSILDGIDQQLKDHATQKTVFQHLSTQKLLGGLDLSPDQLRAARERLATVGLGGTVPQKTAAFSLATGGVTINGGVHMHGVQDMRGLEDQLAKRAARRPQVRRGAR